MQSNCKGTHGYGVVAIMLLAVHGVSYPTSCSIFKGTRSFGIVAILPLVDSWCFLSMQLQFALKEVTLLLFTQHKNMHRYVIRYEATHVEILVYLIFITLYMLMCTCTISQSSVAVSHENLDVEFEYYRFDYQYYKRIQLGNFLVVSS